MFKWSRITHTPIARAAIQQILDNFCEFQLSYHNLNHIERMYEYLHETNEPYDECLDWAVLFHDIVYDDKPNKELRSAAKFSDMKEKYIGCDLSLLDEGHVAMLILQTENHAIQNLKYSAIIRADLNALRFHDEAKRNFENILRESMKLYKCSKVDAAHGSIKFMTQFLPTIERNKIKDTENSKFWDDVIVGIKYTIQWAQEVIDRDNELNREYESLLTQVRDLTALMKDAMNKQDTQPEKDI